MGRIQLGKTHTPEENARIVAFLKTLTGDQPRLELPLLPPSSRTVHSAAAAGLVRQMSGSGADALTGAALFHGVSSAAREALFGHGVRRRVAPGTRLLSAGEPNDRLILLVAGGLDVVLPGSEAPHVRLQPGECAGELSLIDGQPAAADVIAATDAEILEIPHAEVWRVIDSSAEFARNLLRILAGRVRNDDAALRESGDRRRHYERLAVIDALTGLHNRRWLDTAFPAHLARLQQEGRTATLLMADADHFKHLNDAHGHAAGDAVLQRIAQTLMRVLRPDDLVARYGGEEFAALVADVTPDGAAEVADRLRTAVEASHGVAATRCTISIGLAVAAPGEPFAGLAHRADVALLRAKRDGRNCVRA
ncbi:MAG: GGDEF domain-containing protein [Vicinamibacterales bacterium]